jgi:protein-S-isoprenylcysteine O-methyltransferase Ste14
VNLVVLLEGVLIALLAAGVAMFVNWFAPESAAVGAGFVVVAVGMLVLLIAYQLPAGDG